MGLLTNMCFIFVLSLSLFSLCLSLCRSESVGTITECSCDAIFGQTRSHSFQWLCVVLHQTEDDDEWVYSN